MSLPKSLKEINDLKMLKLTPTEFTIAAHVANGKIAKEIASNLYRSYHTVITHLRNLKVKNGLKNSADIAREFALEFGHPKHYISMVFLAIQFSMIVNYDDNYKRKRISKTVIVSKFKNKKC